MKSLTETLNETLENSLQLGIAKLADDQSEKNKEETLTYIIHSGFISGYQNRYGDNLKPPTNVYHRMTA